MVESQDCVVFLSAPLIYQEHLEGTLHVEVYFWTPLKLFIASEGSTPKSMSLVWRYGKEPRNGALLSLSSSTVQSI